MSKKKPRRVAKQQERRAPAALVQPVIVHRRWFIVASACVLLALVFVIYYPIGGHEFVNWDDPQMIENNHFVRFHDFLGPWLTPVGGAYTPLTIVSYAIQASFTTVPTAASIHIFNVCLHAANTLVFIGLLATLFSSRWVILVGATIFALHPLQVEAIAWATARKDTLSGFFIFLGLFIYTRRAKGFPPKALVFLCGLMALFAKPMAVIFPLLLLACDSLQGVPLSKDNLRRKIPFFLLAVIFGVINILVQPTLGILKQDSLLVMWNGLMNGAQTFSWYLAKPLWPTNLAVLYGQGFLAWSDWLLALAFVALFLWALGRASSSTRKALGFSMALFLLPLLLVMRVIPFGDSQSLVQDRFLYFAMSGWGLMFAFITRELGQLIPRQRLQQVLGTTFLCALALALGGATRTTLRNWQTSETLWSNVMKLYPEFNTPRGHLGLHFITHGQAERAIPLLELAIESERNPIKKREFQTNLGAAYARQGRRQEARTLFEQMLAVSPEDPNVLTNLAAEYGADGRWPEALPLLLRSRDIAPKSAPMLYHLTATYFYLGSTDLAKATVKELIQLYPDMAEAKELAKLVDTFKDFAQPH